MEGFSFFQFQMNIKGFHFWRSRTLCQEDLADLFFQKSTGYQLSFTFLILNGYGKQGKEEMPCWCFRIQLPIAGKVLKEQNNKTIRNKNNWEIFNKIYFISFTKATAITGLLTKIKKKSPETQKVRSYISFENTYIKIIKTLNYNMTFAAVGFTGCNNRFTVHTPNSRFHTCSIRLKVTLYWIQSE